MAPFFTHSRFGLVGGRGAVGDLPGPVRSVASRLRGVDTAAVVEGTQLSTAKKEVPDLTGAEWISSNEDGSPGGVEIAFVGDMICMRNGDDHGGPVLVFTQGEWDAFVAGAKDGEFDEPWNWDDEA